MMHIIRRWIITLLPLSVLLAACAGGAQPPPAVSTSVPPTFPPAQETMPLPTIDVPLTPPPTDQPPPPSGAIGPENAAAIQVQVAGNTGGQTISALRVTTDGTIVAATSQGAMLFDPTTLQPAGVLAAGESLFDVIAAPAGGRIVTFPEPGSAPVKVWDLATQTEIEPLRGVLPDFATAAAFSPDGGIVATGDQDGAVTLWELTTGTPLREIRVWDLAFSFDPAMAGEIPQPVQSIAFSADGTQLAVQPVDGMIVFVAASGEGSPHIFTALEIVAGPIAIGVPSPDFRVFGWWSRANFHVVEVGTSDILYTLSHDDFLNGVRFSPDNRLILTAYPGSGGGTDVTFVRLWDAATGAEVVTLDTGGPAFKQATFAPDGTFFVVWSSEGFMTVWGLTVPQ